MFHLQYPRRKGFFTWEELGCLCRALGYPVHLFKEHLTEEIVTEGDGMSIPEIMKMLEFNLLYNVLHCTYNMHSAVWNMCAIRKGIHLLDHKAISFEEINEIRLAYRMYESSDQKGMKINQHTLVRTIKMCGRTIAPMKLMHRLKHMRNNFEEPGRIQLHEFLDLVLWCDLCESFISDDIIKYEEKINELFQFVDFETLLSHFDERLANRLNQKYLLEEWDFGHEKHSAENFQEPPVHSDIRHQQARNDKHSYRYLRNEVGDSQKRVYRAHAGYLRQRPVSAPDLTQYTRRPESRGETLPPSAHCAYETLRKILQSHSAKGSRPFTSEMTERPTTCEYYRISTPRAVNEEDISEIEKKMDSLLFNIETLDGRIDIDLTDEYNDFLPGYKEKLAKRPKVVAESKPRFKRTKHPSDEAINCLAYPKSRMPPSHSRTCDARFRGWHGVKTRSGSHFVLTSPQFENSYQGRLYSKLRHQSQSEVKKLRGDFVYRYIKNNKKSLYRPNTAPGTLENEHLNDSLFSNCTDENMDPVPDKTPTLIPLEAWASTPRECLHDSYSLNSSHDSAFTENGDSTIQEQELKSGQDIEKSSLSEADNRNGNNANVSSSISVRPNHNRKDRHRYLSSPGDPNECYETQIVEMKGIGKIKLLANIAETDCSDEENNVKPTQHDEEVSEKTDYLEHLKIQYHQPPKRKSKYHRDLKKFLASVNDEHPNKTIRRRSKSPPKEGLVDRNIPSAKKNSRNLQYYSKISKQSGFTKQTSTHNESMSETLEAESNLTKGTVTCSSSNNESTSKKKQNQTKYSRIAKRFKGELPVYLSKRLLSGNV